MGQADNAQSEHAAATLPSVEEVLADRACSHWLRQALLQALARDPVDAANDAELLAALLDRRCRNMLAGT